MQGQIPHVGCALACTMNEMQSKKMVSCWELQAETAKDKQKTAAKGSPLFDAHITAGPGASSMHMGPKQTGGAKAACIRKRWLGVPFPRPF